MVTLAPESPSEAIRLYSKVAPGCRRDMPDAPTHTRHAVGDSRHLHLGSTRCRRVDHRAPGPVLALRDPQTVANMMACTAVAQR